MLHITCNMCTRDLPDMYALSPQASGIHIRQIPRVHVTTITYIDYTFYKRVYKRLIHFCPLGLNNILQLVVISYIVGFLSL